MNPLVEAEILKRDDFLRALGMSRPTFTKLMRTGLFGKPPRQGRKGVYTRDYLTDCQQRWTRFRQITDQAPGGPA